MPGLDALKQDQDFMSASPQEQAQYLREVYLPKADPDFAKASPQEQEAYIKQVALPSLGGGIHGAVSTKQAAPASAPAQATVPPESSAPIPITTPFGVIPNTSHEADINNQAQSYAASRMLKGASFGYVDPNVPKPAHADAAGNIAEFTGASLPFEGLANLAGRAIQGAGLLNDALRSGAVGAAYGGLESHPQNQLDVGARLRDAAEGFAAGAGLHLAGAGLSRVGGKILKGRMAREGVPLNEEIQQPAQTLAAQNQGQQPPGETAVQPPQESGQAQAVSPAATLHQEVQAFHAQAARAPEHYQKLAAKAKELAAHVTPDEFEAAMGQLSQEDLNTVGRLLGC